VYRPFDPYHIFAAPPNQAGHCPQDEQPEAVNNALLQWIVSDVMGQAGPGAASGSEVAAAAPAAS
jgi:hypothetical protein